MLPPDLPATDFSTATTPLQERIATLQRKLEENRPKENTNCEEQERLRFLLDSIEDYALVTLDREACMVGWSYGAECLLGYSMDEAMRRSLEELQDRAQAIATLHQTLYISRDLAGIQ